MKKNRTMRRNFLLILGMALLAFIGGALIPQQTDATCHSITEPSCASAPGGSTQIDQYCGWDRECSGDCSACCQIEVWKCSSGAIYTLRECSNPCQIWA